MLLSFQEQPEKKKRAKYNVLFLSEYYKCKKLNDLIYIYNMYIYNKSLVDLNTLQKSNKTQYSALIPAATIRNIQD